jgi:flagellar hook-length control protein FliK
LVASLPQQPVVETLSGGPSKVRTAGNGVKRKGLIDLFSSLLAEARERVGAADGKKPGAVQNEAAGKKSSSRASGPSASAPGTTKVDFSQGPKKDDAALFARNGRAEGADTELIRAGPTARISTGKNTVAVNPAEDAVKEEAESSKKTLVARRRVGVRDGTGGQDIPEQIAALSAVGDRRNHAAARQSAEGRPADPLERGVEGAESKKKDKRKERVELEFYDHRSSAASTPSDQPPAGAKIETTQATERNAATAEAELVVNLRSSPAEHGGEGDPRSNAAPSASFSDALARELREAANADIVKHASLVLRDGGEGLLRLSLKPESLGAVKIRLEMADNKIAGRILVESEEALKAFEKELASLEQAFRDGGFDGASLELGVSSDDAGKDAWGRNEDGSPRPYFSERLASTYDASLASAEKQTANPLSETLVNVLV